jgi:hypothetical protein
MKVVLDSDWDAEVSVPVGYITTCRCGHDAGDHAAFQNITSEEITRRGRVAIRLDELLEVSTVSASSIPTDYSSIFTRTRGKWLISTTSM